MTIDHAGLRTTGDAIDEASRAPILAVGDSFTFGEEVADQETWPAQLRHVVNRRVLNGGVSGYGFDQIVLRAERLTSLFKPSVIVVGFIADDIHRCEMRRVWWREKPWFSLERGELVPRGLPVPSRDPRPTVLGSVRMLELLLRRLPPELQHWLGYHVRIHPMGTGEIIAFSLLERLAALQRSSGAIVLVVAFYDRVVWENRAIAGEQQRITRRMLDGAIRKGMGGVDSFAALARADPQGLYKAWHMNAQGNFELARLIAKTLSCGRQPSGLILTPVSRAAPFR